MQVSSPVSEQPCRMFCDLRDARFGTPLVVNGTDDRGEPMKCDCVERHVTKRVVLTGGPGGGKTAVLELAQRLLCPHVMVLPEAASILFSGGFPRGATVLARTSAQRAIFHVQRELEALAQQEPPPALTLCDRGSVDGWAYWPGEDPNELFAQCHTSREAEFARYAAVIHLRTPPLGEYNHVNPLRTETVQVAAEIDERIARAWSGHPRYLVVSSEQHFLDKAQHALELLRREVPGCCRPPSAGAAP